MPYKNKQDYAVYMKAYRSRMKEKGTPVKRGSNKRKPRIHRTDRCAFHNLEFLAWDGEGVDKPRNRYIMLSNSNRQVLESHDLSIEPERIFEFLLEHGSKKGIVNVIYGGGYDFTHWIYGLPDSNRVELLTTQRTNWGRYKIKYVPRKSFSIKRYAKDKKDIKKMTVWDVIGFFQKKFVDSIVEWLAKDITPQQLLMIERMKSVRDTFEESNRDEILEYNFQECELLSKLMTRLRDLLQIDPDNPDNPKPWIHVQRWDGAGAVAAAIYRKEGTKVHTGNTVQFSIVKDVEVQNPDWHYRNIEEQKTVEHALRSAYFGGRIECFKKGRANCKGWDADLVSAYPAQMLNLPSFAEGGRWNNVTTFNPTAFGVWRLKWNCGMDKKHTIFPFPYRTRDGEVLFPYMGAGWYHTSEVKAALDDERNNIEIYEGWIWTPSNHVKPFAFVQRYFDQRVKLQAMKEYGEKGHPAQMVVKLGLNSLYGKTAQTLGSEFALVEALIEGVENSEEDHNGDKIFGKVSPNFNLAWAGAITAGCRSMLYSEAIKRESDIVMIQTDGLFGNGEPPPYVETKQLGSWECAPFADSIVAQAGVYWLNKIDKKTGQALGFEKGITKTRGFNKTDVSWERVLNAWEKGEKTIVYKSKPRFVTMGACATKVKNKFEDLAKWIAQDRKLDLYIDSKRDVDSDKGYKLHKRMYPATCRTNPDYMIDKLPSREYDPKWKDKNEDDIWMRNTLPSIEGGDYVVNGDGKTMLEKLEFLRSLK